MNQSKWLDDLPYKELVWSETYDVNRKYAPDNIVAMQVECAVLNRLLNSNDPPDILAKLNITAAWLDERL